MDNKLTAWGLRPADWSITKWHEFAKKAGRPIVVNAESNVKQITVKVRHLGLIERRLNPNRKREIQTPNQVEVRTGQFVISKIDARNGACGFVPRELDGAIVTHDFPVYEIDTTVAHPCYLDHVFGMRQFWRLCEQVSDGTTNRVRLQIELFEELDFPLPPLCEQRRIAAVLDSIDDAIQRTEAVIEATQQLRKALLHELLTRGVPGWHTEWKQVKGIGMVPADWEIVPLEEVASVQTGRSVRKQQSLNGLVEIPYLTVVNVKDGYVDLSQVKTMHVLPSEIERYSLKCGDVLFTEGGDADKLGRGCVWYGEVDPCIHQNHVFAVRPNPDRLRPEFLSAYASSAKGKNYFLLSAKQTTNLASINSTQLKMMPVPLPSIDEQIAIENLLASIKFCYETRVQELDGLKLLKISCADALLSGRVRVPVRSPDGGET